MLSAFSVRVHSVQSAVECFGSGSALSAECFSKPLYTECYLESAHCTQPVESQRALSDFQFSRGDEPQGGADDGADNDLRHAIKRREEDRTRGGHTSQFSHTVLS